MLNLNIVQISFKILGGNRRDFDHNEIVIGDHITGAFAFNGLAYQPNAHSPGFEFRPAFDAEFINPVRSVGGGDKLKLLPPASGIRDTGLKKKDIQKKSYDMIEFHHVQLFYEV
jgi:hypothetical protein